MQRSHRLLIGLVWTLALAFPFGAASAQTLVAKPESKLWLDGKSTIHEFSSTASKLEVRFSEDSSRWAGPARDGAAIEAFIRAKGVTALEVVVPVTGLHSGKDGLDKNMYKALLASQHPDIRFVLSGYDVVDSAGATAMTVNAAGTLTVAGVARPIQIPVRALRQGETLRLTGSAPVLMSQHGIKPPKMMMGTLKTADQVVVHFDLVVAASPATGAAKAE